MSMKVLYDLIDIQVHYNKCMPIYLFIVLMNCYKGQSNLFTTLNNIHKLQSCNGKHKTMHLVQKCQGMFGTNENKNRFFSSCYCKIIILPPAPYIGMIQSYRAISKIVSFYKQPTECGRSRTKHIAQPRSFFSRRS